MSTPTTRMRAAASQVAGASVPFPAMHAPPPPDALLQAERRRLRRLLEESDETLAYHDKRRVGLQATNDVYRQHLAVLDAQLTPAS